MAKGLKIWKTIMLVSLLCLLLALGGGMLACHPGESHTHSWSETYSYDDDNHWLSCSGCDQRTGTEAHVFDNDQDLTCNVCGYTRHVHTLVWKNDGNVNGKHWQEYSCEHHSDERLNEGDHVWGNDNICDVCLLDKTPPHVHHEITRYDETQHWTTYDCTEHGNEKINPQPHTFTNGSKCDGCDYDRDAEHQHSLSGWIHNNDPQYHWKEYTCWHHADEQLEKTPHNFNGDDECDDCGYVRQHLHDNYLVWNFDQTQHWQTYTCEDSGKTEKEETRGDHDFGTGGVCSCGLNRNYIRVYDIYTTQKTYERDNGISDDEIAGFTDWYNSLKAQGVDHVGVNASGDAIFYNSTTDYTGTLTYVSERTVAVSTSLVNAWFTVKVTVDGQEPKVLAIGKTGRNGVELKFFPVWKDATYTVCVATEAELEAIDEGPRPIPKYYVNTAASTYVIQPFEGRSIRQNFYFIRGLGLEDAGKVEGIQLKEYMEQTQPVAYYFAKDDDWTDGWYKLTFDSTSDNLAQDGMMHSFSMNTETHLMEKPQYMQIVGKTAVSFIWIDSSIDKLFLRWSGMGRMDGSLKLEMVNVGDLTVKNNTEFDMRVNQPEEAKQLEFDISKLEAGKYRVINIYKEDRILQPTYTYCSFSIDGGATQSLRNAVLEIPDSAKTLKCIQTEEHRDVFLDPVYYQAVTLRLIKIEDYTTTDEYSVEAKNGYKEDSDLGHYYLGWKTPTTGAYHLTLSGSPEFTNVKVVAHPKENIYGTGGITWLNHNTSADKLETHEAYFTSTQDMEYWIEISTDETGNSQYPQTLTFKLEKIESSEFEVNTEATATFGAESTTLSYLGELTKGAYLVVMMGENLENVTLEVTAIKDKCTVTSSGINSFIVHDDCTATVLAKYSGSDNYPTIKFVLIKMDDGTDIGGTMTSFAANLSAERYFQVYTFTETEANYYKLTLSSLSNLQNVYVYCATYDESKDANNQVLVQNWLSPTETEVQTREFVVPINNYGSFDPKLSTVGAKYAIVVLQMKNSDYPGDINLKLEKTLYSNLSVPNSYAGVSFIKDEHATNIEVWCAALDEKRTPNDGEWQKKADIDPKDYTATDYITYVENNKENINNKYLYWKIVFKDSTGKYVDGSIIESNGTLYKNTGLTTTVTVNVPEDFEGKHIILPFADRVTSLAYNGVYVIDVVPGQTQYVVNIYSPSVTKATGYTIYPKLSDNIANKYTVSTPVVTIGSTSGVVNITHKVCVTATINLPDNYEQPADSNLAVTIYYFTKETWYPGDKVLATINPDKKTATVTVFTEYYEKLAVRLTGGLGEGYEASAEQYDVTVAEDHKTGTATLTVNQRTKVDVEITVPAMFMGGEITLKFYKYTGGELAKEPTNYTFELAPNNSAETAKQTFSVYLPMNTSYKIEFVGPTNMGYAAEPIEKLELNDTTVKAEINVIDHIQITANVDLFEGAVEESVTVYLIDSDTEEKISEATVSVAADETSGKKTGLGILYGTSGCHYKIGLSVSTTDLTSSIDWEYADVQMNGITGEATLVGTEKYSVEITFGFENATTANSFSTTAKPTAFHVYKDGVQMSYDKNGGRRSYVDLGAFEGTGADKKIISNVYISKTIFDVNTVYAITLESNSARAMAGKGFVLPSAKITGWSEEQLHVTLRMNFLSMTDITNQAKPIEYTINISEEYKPQNTLHTMYVYEMYNAEWSAGFSSTANKNKGHFNVDFASAQDGKIVGTYSNYVQSDLIYFNLTGGDLTNVKDSIKSKRNVTKEWYAEPGKITYDEEGKGHVEITIKKTVPIKLTIPALDNGTPTDAFVINIDILDANGSNVALYSVNVPKDASVESFEKTIYILDWNEKYTAKVEITTTNAAYFVNAEKSFEFKEDNGHVLQLNLTKKTPVKVTIPNLDNRFDTVKFDISLKVNTAEGENVGTFTISVPENASNDDFEYYIYVPEWLEGYTMEVSSSTSGSAYTVNSATHKETDGVHSIEIDVTMKDVLKVTVTGLDAELKAGQFTLNVKVKDAQSKDVTTFTLTIPAYTASDAATFGPQYVYFDKWEAGYTAEVTSNNSTIYNTASANIDEGSGKVHELEIKVEEKPKIKITIPNLVKDLEEVTTKPNFIFNFYVKDSGNKQILKKQLEIPRNSGPDFEYSFYFDGWKEGYKATVDVVGIGSSNQSAVYNIIDCTDGGVAENVWSIIVNVKVKPKVTLVIEGLQSELNVPEFQYSLKIVNENKLTSQQKPTEVQNFGNNTIHANAGSYSKIFYMNGWEDGYKFQFARVSSDLPYGFNVGEVQNESEDVYKLTVTAYLLPVIKVSIPALDSKYNSAAFSMYVDIKNSELKQVGYPSFTVHEKSGNDFSYSCYASQGYDYSDYESFTLSPSISALDADKIPYKLAKIDPAKLTKQEDGSYLLTINLELKPSLKVVVKGLDGSAAAFSFTAQINDSGNTKKVSFTVNVDANANDGFEFLYISDEEWNISDIFVAPSTTSSMPVKVLSGAISEDGGQYTLTVQVQKRVKLTVSVTFPSDFSSALRSFAFSIKDSTGAKEYITGSMIVFKNATTVAPKVLYMDENLVEGCQVTFTRGGTFDGYNVTTELNIADSTLTIKVTAAT